MRSAVMRAGWVVSDFAGEKTVCGQDGTWQGTGETFTASLPAERHVEVFYFNELVVTIPMVVCGFALAGFADQVAALVVIVVYA